MTSDAKALVEQAEKMRTKWRFQRWLFAGFTVLFGFVAFFSETAVGSWLHAIIALPYYGYGVIAGLLLGDTWVNWHGSPELKLLVKMCQQLKVENEAPVSNSH